MFHSLDVGCGIMQRGDINLDRGKATFHDRSRYVRADAHYLPFRNRSFPKVICSHVIEHCKNPFKVLKELLRVGRVVRVSCPHRLSLTARHYKGHIHAFTCQWFRDNCQGGKHRVGIRLDLERPIWCIPLEIVALFW